MRHVLTLLSGLVINDRTGKVSNTKLAAATAYSVGTFWFCWHNYHTGFNTDMWLIYFGIVAGHKTAEKFIGMKYGAQPQTPTEQSGSD